MRHGILRCLGSMSMQQIEEGLKEGKKPYSIGKQLTAWFERLFETAIPADTIKHRAQRMKEKLGTNVPSDATPEFAKENEHIQEIKIERRAERMRTKLGTNVPSNITPESAKENEHIQEIKIDGGSNDDVGA